MRFALAAALLAGRAVAAEPVRVGLASGVREVAITAEDATLEVPGLAAPLALRGETVVVWARPALASTFRIQVGALADAGAARALAARLERELGGASVAVERGDGLYRVRGGTFSGRAAAEARLQRLGVAFPGAFLVEEGALPGLRVALAAADRVIDASGPVRLTPGPEARLAAAGTPYRGAFEVLPAKGGGLTLVNEVDLEDYLRGVVPKEMGPLAYPEPEALKSQAVAARSYALATRGENAGIGYDLCATAACQVYGGAGAEHPVSDAAIAATRGLVLADAGGVLRAYFSATCGGHTEAVENVFRGEKPRPALAAVACAPDPARARRLPDGAAVSALVGEDGFPVGPRAALLAALGVLAEPPPDPLLRARPGGTEVEEVVRRAARAAARPGSGPRLAEDFRQRHLWTHLFAAFALEERTDALVDPVDALALVRAVDGGDLDPHEHRAAAALALLGALPAFPDGRIQPDLRPSRGLVLACIARVLESLGAFRFEEATLVDIEEDAIVSRSGAAVLRDRLTAGTVLLRAVTGGEPRPARQALVLPGDRLRLLRRAGELAVVIVVEDPGGSDDRRARNSRWTAEVSREELERRVATREAVGSLRALRVIGRGASGRPLELEVEGTAGRARLQGYDIKTVLGLRDDRVVIEALDPDPAGLPRRFRFSGRGWGHGVGLCQEGAFGMALRGAGFREILERYYPGARLVAVAEVEGIGD